MPTRTAHFNTKPISFTKLAATVLCILWATGCFDGTPTDVKLLREGAALETRSEYDKALAKYTEAASLGNADAFKRLGDIAISRDYALQRPENADDYATGYDGWLAKAKLAVDRAGDFYAKAKQAGCTNQLDASMEKLLAARARIAETEARVKEAKEQKRQEAEALKAVFDKAAEVGKSRINFCGFFLGMAPGDADLLARHYGLEDWQWSMESSTAAVYKLSFTLDSIRHILRRQGRSTRLDEMPAGLSENTFTKFDGLSRAVMDYIGPMYFQDDPHKYGFGGYEYRGKGQTARMSSERLVLEDAHLANTANAEVSKGVVAKLVSDMVAIPDRNYSMCKYEVTQALWKAVMGWNRSWFRGGRRWASRTAPRTPMTPTADFPVECVSWYDCQKFLEKLNALPEVKETGFTYRLPTAEEWDYACSAGAAGAYCRLAGGREISLNTLDKVAWFDGNSKNTSHPVGKKKSNAFGLYDMIGNVREWTSSTGDDLNIFLGNDGGHRRVYCGSSWNFNADWCAVRTFSLPALFTHSLGDPNYRNLLLGLRLASDNNNETTMANMAELKAIAERVQAERKAIAEASKEAVAKLAADMVAIPGKNYSMCKYEVTQALWFAVMGRNPSWFEGADLPVETVSWDDCQKFLEKLNALPEVKATSRTYRLPTKNEWKYACRAGSTGDYCKLADGTEISKETIGEVAWYDANSNDETHSVGQKKPNAFGLYDMHGNVREWTSEASRNMVWGYWDGTYRVPVCGGCWRDGAFACRAGNEDEIITGKSNDSIGLRLASDSDTGDGTTTANETE